MQSHHQKIKRQDIYSVGISNSPELIFWLIFAVCGGVVAGWFFIGAGFLLTMLIPATYFVYRFFKKPQK